jgi:hypothetical protein
VPPPLSSGTDAKGYEASLTATLEQEMRSFPNPVPDQACLCGDVCVMVWSPEVLCQQHCTVPDSPQPGLIADQLMCVTRAVASATKYAQGHRGIISVMMEDDQSDFEEWGTTVEAAMKQHCEYLVQLVSTESNSVASVAPAPGAPAPSNSAAGPMVVD